MLARKDSYFLLANLPKLIPSNAMNITTGTIIHELSGTNKTIKAIMINVKPPMTAAIPIYGLLL